jgi:predicted glutamine amidotransferase
MCGLVGVVGPWLTQEHKKLFDFLLILDQVRGTDSTGVGGYAVNNKQEEKFFIEKCVGLPYNLDKNAYMNEFNTKVLMGHNRAATIGQITKQNAHPFEQGNIIGAHNGTVRMGSLMTFAKYKELTVDSEIIFAELNAKEGDLKEVYGRVDGAMALTWIDKGDGSFNVIRNHERPLYYLPMEERKGFFYASLPWMLRAVAFHAPKLFPAGEKVRRFRPHFWYKFEINSDKITPIKPKLVKHYVKPKQEVYHNHRKGGHTPARIPNFTPGANSGTVSFRDDRKLYPVDRFVVNGQICPPAKAKVRYLYSRGIEGWIIKSKRMADVPTPNEARYMSGSVKIDHLYINDKRINNYGKWYPNYILNTWERAHLPYTKDCEEEETIKTVYYIESEQYSLETIVNKSSGTCACCSNPLDVDELGNCKVKMPEMDIVCNHGDCQQMYMQLMPGSKLSHINALSIVVSKGLLH